MVTQRELCVVGNWKMYKTNAEAVNFIEEFALHLDKAKARVYLAVPFTAIQVAAEAAMGSQLLIGSQNINSAFEGAFTGEVSASMVVEAGGSFTLLGHSERRHYFHETDEEINRKVKRALEVGLKPFLCIGESLVQRERGTTQQVLEEQITKALKEIPEAQLQRVAVAYEPIWAIGTGQTASPEMVQETHLLIRDCLARHWSRELADQLSLLYGGSVKADNAATLLALPDVDGLLVGGASLSVAVFSQIVYHALSGQEVPS